MQKNASLASYFHNDLKKPEYAIVVGQAPLEFKNMRQSKDNAHTLSGDED